VSRDDTTRWPAPDAPGLLIGEAAELLGITVKAIRVYHARGLVPEMERDESGYRRYGPEELVALARINRLRAIGLTLREIAPLLGAADGGAALRERLAALDAQLGEEVAERERRRAMLGLLLAEGIDDPIGVTLADVWEERSISLLRAAVPGLTPEQELLERRFSRALAALLPAPSAADEAAALDALAPGLGDDAAFAGQHARFHALAAADPGDPEVAALAAEMRTTMREAMLAFGAAMPDGPAVGEEEMRRLQAGMAAAVAILPEAQRRVMELTLPALFGDGP